MTVSALEGFRLPPVSLDDLRTTIGQPSISSWHLVSQEVIDRFAEATGDRQFIHVDPQRAAGTAFGGTIAHGFLTLSLLSVMVYETLPPLLHLELNVNQGFERLRFVSPVRSGSRIRGRFVLASISARATGWIQLTYDVTMEIEEMQKPALSLRWLTLSKVEPVKSGL